MNILNKINFLFKVWLKAKIIALKRRLFILIKKDFYPYPDVPKNVYLSPSDMHCETFKNLEQRLSIRNNNIAIEDWQQKARSKLEELIGFNSQLYCDTNLTKKYIFKKKYNRKRIYIKFDTKRFAPIDLISKINNSKPKGIMICMQGTNSGAHLNLGEIRMPADPYKVFNKSDLAIQAADQDFLAISYERIGYGERQERKLEKISLNPSLDTSLHSILMSSSMIGETASELVAILKWLKQEKDYNIPIWLIGYSAAGYAALITAAIEPQISGIAIGGCIGRANKTILKRRHSAFHEIPSMLKWFDQDSIVSLMAPRPTIIISGHNDPIWPYEEAKFVVDIAKESFIKLDSSDNLNLIMGNKGHTYYPNLMWPSINKYF